MHIKELIFVALLATIKVVSGYGAGAPKEACGDMIPQHHTPPQTSPFPYKITVNKKIIRAGESVQVSITSGGSVKDFKGFFIQGRVGDRPVGKFSETPGVKLVDCGNSRGVSSYEQLPLLSIFMYFNLFSILQTGATHTKADSKDKIVLTWTAPPNLSETVKFRVTVAKDGGTFWVGHQSTPLQIKGRQ